MIKTEKNDMKVCLDMSEHTTQIKPTVSTARKVGTLTVTGEAQFLHDTFNGRSINGDALEAARRVMGESTESKANKSDRHDLQSYLVHLDRIQNIVTRSQQRGQLGQQRATRLINSLIDSICCAESGFITQQLSDRAKKLEIQRLNNYEQYMAKQEGRAPLHYGPEDISRKQWESFLATTQSNQRARISSWINYLAEPDSVYPTWFKFYAVRSLLTLKNSVGFSQQEGPDPATGRPLKATDHHYKKRSGDTLDAFPELNREALAKTFAEINNSIGSHRKYKNLPSHMKTGMSVNEATEATHRKATFDAVDNQAVEQPSDTQKTTFETNFAKLYAQKMESIGCILDSERANMDGYWITYNEGQADQLAKSLEGFNTSWCIADYGTADRYLSAGLIHIYYSTLSDDPNARQVPRLCIRYLGNSIAEVRGINHSQAVENIALPTLEDKLKTIEGGATYLKNARFQAHAQAIKEKQSTNEPLSIDELKALWGIGYNEEQMNGFGYGEDHADIAGENEVATTLSSIRLSRDKQADLRVIFESKGNLRDAYVSFEMPSSKKNIEYLVYTSIKSGVDPEYIVDRLFDKGFGWVVAEYIGKLGNVNHQELANRLIETGFGESVVNNIDDFKGLNHQEIINGLIESGNALSVAEHLQSFDGIDYREVVDKLFEYGVGDFVAEYLEKFHGIDHQVIANRLIANGFGQFVVEYLEKFKNLGQDVACKLIESGFGEDVVIYLDDFKGLNHQEIVDKLINLGGARYVAANINNFKGLNHQEIANRLIDDGYGFLVAEYLYKFYGIDHQEIASRLIAKGEGLFVAEYLDQFKGLDQNTKDKLL